MKVKVTTTSAPQPAADNKVEEEAQKKDETVPQKDTQLKKDEESPLQTTASTDTQKDNNNTKEDLEAAALVAPLQQQLTLQPSGFTDAYLESMNEVLSNQPLPSVLEWCCASLPNFFQVTSFGSAGMVIIHELHKLNLKVPVIFLNTLYHFQETLEHARAVEVQYGLQVFWYSCPKAANREEFEKVFKSSDMWISHPRRFEYLTKVEPLERSLEEHKVGAWITGRRREQGALRAEIPILEIDVDGRIKVNPLAHWTRQEVWDYLSRENVPYNPLFDKSYASIGDTVTTTQTTDLSLGERSGRFHQFGGAKTECGIHVRRTPAPAYPNSLTSSGSNESAVSEEN